MRPLVLEHVPGFEPLAHPDPPLADGEIELRPFTDADALWLVHVAEKSPELSGTLLWPEKGERFTAIHAYALVDLWRVGFGASFTVHAPDRKGLVFAVVPDHGSDRVALGGAKLPGSDWAPAQAARAMRLVAAWVRETMGREPYAAIPCEEPRYIAWAEEAGLPWDTALPGAMAR